MVGRSGPDAAAAARRDEDGEDDKIMVENYTQVFYNDGDLKKIFDRRRNLNIDKSNIFKFPC
jgi:hypothetical protein